MGGLGGVKVGFCVGDGTGVGNVAGVTVGDPTGVGVGDVTGVTVGDATGVGVGDVTGVTVGDGGGFGEGDGTGVGVGDGTGVCKRETFCSDKVGLEGEGNQSKSVDDVAGSGPVYKKRV